MDGGQAHKLVAQAIERLTPDVDLGTLDDQADLRDELALDSIDFLVFVDMIGKQVGHLIQEYDYPVLTTVGGCVDYLQEQGSGSYVHTWS
ncbi:acyl carrier protein [Actinomadura rudentiformis]|uniref:Acyl carrier protein n=1 Tax=Actinomadura rudentiformis TaxID=359158 RepID=A0A6H9YE46_9ACTN|nr:phosphopantetheine-binding protein [Actinomadura rudentiformis]KAB2343651.1 acyl carrier protein [Actinomadura rudentiformis]